jgi:hypothetical protein
MSKAVNTTGGLNRIKFQSVSSQLQSVDVDVVHRTKHMEGLNMDLNDKPINQDKGCYFVNQLDTNRRLNITASYSRFFHEIAPMVQSLPELLYHQEAVVGLLIKR